MNSQKQKDEAIDIILSNEVMAGLETDVSGRIRGLTSDDVAILREAVSKSFRLLRAVLIAKTGLSRN